MSQRNQIQWPIKRIKNEGKNYINGVKKSPIKNLAQSSLRFPDSEWRWRVQWIHSQKFRLTHFDPLYTLLLWNGLERKNCNMAAIWQDPRLMLVWKLQKQNTQEHNIGSRWYRSKIHYFGKDLVENREQILEWNPKED